MARHTVVLCMRPVPWPYRLVYRARGLTPPMGSSGHSPGALVPARFRRFHRWYADLLGYFWLPCMLCSREFAGHEIVDSVPDPMQSGASYMICPLCTVNRNRTP